jgi:hypothetical protein
MNIVIATTINDGPTAKNEPWRARINTQTANNPEKINLECIPRDERKSLGADRAAARRSRNRRHDARNHASNQWDQVIELGQLLLMNLA